MKRKPAIRALKGRAWKVLSEWVRRKDADADGITHCYTCGKSLNWKYDAQAGHAIPGRHNAVLLDPEIIRPQCQRCNVWSGGVYHIFATKLIKEHGMAWWEAKLAHAREGVKLTREDLERFIEVYKRRLQEL